MGPAPLTIDLHDALSGFTGTEISILSEARSAHASSPDFLNSLLELIGHADPLFQRAGGWLLLESARDETINANTAIASAAPHLDHITDWQCALTLLQLADLITAPVKQHAQWAAFAQSHLAHKRPFLRAWAVNALCRLAAHHDEHHTTATSALAAARDDPAASVRARARNIKLPT